MVAIDPEDLAVTAGTDLAGMPRDTIRAIDVAVESYPAEIGADEVLLRGALLRSAQMAGAITAVFELTKTYVEQRVQFGKPIGMFQSVQAHLVELAQASALSALSVDRAGAAALRWPASFEIIATKSLANRHAAWRHGPLTGPRRDRDDPGVCPAAVLAAAAHLAGRLRRRDDTESAAGVGDGRHRRTDRGRDIGRRHDWSMT